ncbi:uncharacterized protein LOC128956086 [Oppia nitens]|uniref:uncharacterized protein LOC128956086 n=1 Tax=Oppia nitens TaxID=1686743 RepID=UPI0023DAB146|nr:uncharacterized protein LOC128956086 [Oppia nitens]
MTDEIGYNSTNNDNQRNIYVINVCQELSIKNEFRLNSLSDEKVVIKQLIQQYLNLKSSIGTTNDGLLILHTSVLLTRLMTATIYMISQGFHNYSVIPSSCLGSDGSSDDDSNQRPGEGLIWLFRNTSDGDDSQHNNESYDQLRRLLANLDTRRDVNDNDGLLELVEVISVPHLMSDNTFYETVYNANTIQMINILISMSNVEPIL